MFAWLYWDPQRELFTVPWINRPVGWYGLFFALGFMLGYFILIRVFLYHLSRVFPEKSFIQLKKESTVLTDALSWFVVVGTLVGARLGHVFFYDWPRYSHTPADIIKVWEGGLASHGGAIGILVALWFYLRTFQGRQPWMSYLTLLDSLVIPVPLAGMCIRIGNFFNQEILGKATEMPWGVIFGHPFEGGGLVPRHPVQLYEGVAYLLLFLVLMTLWQKKRETLPTGFMSGLFFVALFTVRFILEYFKMPQEVCWLEYPLLNMGQFLSIPFIGIGAVLVYRSEFRKKSILGIVVIGSCFLSGEALYADEGQAKKAYERGQYKEGAHLYQQLAERALAEKKGEYLAMAALCCYRDQDDVAAFSSYLLALESVVPGKEPLVSAEEQALYEEALKLYLDPSHSNPKEAALLIKKTYVPIVSARPDYLYLNFLITSAYANLGLFDEFFERFYRSYQAFPQSYMAVKTVGILHIKLFERLTDPAERAQERRKALAALSKARELYPSDPGLYKILIFFAEPDKKKEALHLRLTQLIEQNVQVPRSDLSFYIHEAIEQKEMDLAKQFIDKARQWYPYSRVITTAEQMLKTEGG